MGRPGRKRRYSQANHNSSQASKANSSQTSQSTSSQSRKKKFEVHVQFPSEPFERCLTCGTGEQLGHPGRETTRKPRAVDTFDENVRFVQTCAGGVHSLLLTDKGQIFSCGVNEKGVVPVRGIEAGDVTDRFTEIEFSPEIAEHGKIVQIAAGGSFAAALTELGSVIAWGNLRDSNGDFTAHPQFRLMQDKPVVVTKFNKVKVVKIAAGENHLVMLTHIGQVLTFGDGSQGQLGRSARFKTIRQSFLADESGSHLIVHFLYQRKAVKFIDIFAGSNWTILKDSEERLFGFGLNNFGQLGFEPDQKINNSQANGATMQDEGSYNIFWPQHITAFDSDSKWTHISGAVHLALRNERGEVYTIGKNVDNYLGIGTWTGRDDNEHWRYHTLQRVVFPNDVKIAGITASMGCTIAWTEDGKVYGFGYDSSGQLGLGIKDEDEEKVVSTPRKITSAHLDDYKVEAVSLADQHAIFLAKHVQRA